jgi:L-rhamnose-H+ transport protein
MLTGIIWAVLAGLMLGLYALPEKFAKDFEFENTWGLMFLINMIIVPLIAGFILVTDFVNVLQSIPFDILMKMAFASLLWGVGVMMWGKAIDYIGLSLGFSIFIGTVILVGSLLPFIVEGLPPNSVFVTILAGIFVVLIGVLFNGKAGLAREADQANAMEGVKQHISVTTGILIAIVGGLLATGFSYANAAGRPIIHEACQSAGNAEWVTAVVVMFVIYIGGALFVIPYFIYQLRIKNLWRKFKTPHILNNIVMTSAMGILNFAASASFAYAAFQLGQAGNTVGYAIFNTVCVAVAIISGIITGEWQKASGKATKYLYLGLATMILGVIIISAGNGMA